MAWTISTTDPFTSKKATLSTVAQSHREDLIPLFLLI